MNELRVSELTITNNFYFKIIYLSLFTLRCVNKIRFDETFICVIIKNILLFIYYYY